MPWYSQEEDGADADEEEDKTPGTKKRRRSDVTEAAGEAKAKPKTKTKTMVEKQKQKQIVRIRAKVHCTAAGLPGLDAPVRSKGQDTEGDDASNLPDWHPLHKVGFTITLFCVLLLLSQISYQIWLACAAVPS